MNPSYQPCTWRPCPVCDAITPEVLYEQRFGEESPSLIKGYNVSVCAQCGCGYANDIPIQEQFDEYYRDMSKYEYAHQGGKSSPYDVRRFNQLADEIEILCPDKSANILDIGCATGQFLAVLKARGFNNIQGAEPSPRCADIARELYGIEVLTAPLGSPELKTRYKEHYSLISLIAVVEHLREAKATLSSLLPLLERDGLLLIEVPNAGRFADFENAPFQQFSTEHINFFTQNSLDNLMAKLGMERVWSQEIVHEISYKTFDPGIIAAYQRIPHGIGIHFDTQTQCVLNNYIHQSSRAEAQTMSRLEPLIESQAPLIIWGVGTNILHLLNKTRLAEANIVTFVDSNPKYQCRSLLGRPIVAPESLENIEGNIVIGSWVFQLEIERNVREQFGLQHAIVKLYPDR